MAEPLYRLRVPQSIVDLIRTLHPELKRKVRSSLRAVLRDPASGKALREELEGLRSFRVGRLRIIYRVAERGRTVELVAIGPRARVYMETFRLIKRGE